MRCATTGLALMLLIIVRLSVTVLSMFCRSSARRLIKRILWAELSCAAPCARRDAYQQFDQH